MSFWLGSALQTWLGANKDAPENAPCSEGCRVGKDGERISRAPCREQGVCDGAGQGEMRSDPEHFSHTQDLAVFKPEDEEQHPCTEEMFAGEGGVKMSHLINFKINSDLKCSGERN